MNNKIMKEKLLNSKINGQREENLMGKVARDVDQYIDDITIDHIQDNVALPFIHQDETKIHNLKLECDNDSCQMTIWPCGRWPAS